MLPANEIVLDEIIKKELDIERYESQIQSVNISISKHFADYRQLKEDLELVHIYCTGKICIHLSCCIVNNDSNTITILIFVVNKVN